LPDAFEIVRRQSLDEQTAAGGNEADVDHVFDIPLDTTKLVTGFSYDEAEPADGFAVLAPTASA
jgi:hypothetical protein